MSETFESIASTRAALETRGYFADAGLATSLFLALRMEKALGAGHRCGSTTT